MANELLFTVVDKTPVPATPVELADVGLKERGDVEEWVIKHPAILGPDVAIVTSEFAGWSSKKGEKDLDRLDILGLASDGRLVLAELKRGKAAATIHMQALNYAARASRFTVAQLAIVHQRFHDLRHACASFLLAQGVPMRVVMDVLGHTQMATTADLYSHVMPELQRQAADRMEEVLGG